MSHNVSISPKEESESEYESDTDTDYNRDECYDPPTKPIWNLNGRNSVCDEIEIEGILMHDKKDEFVQLIRSQLDAGAVNSVKKRKKLIDWVLAFGIDHNAFRCLEALLKGETGLVVDINAPIFGDLLPLEYVARILSPKFTELFLEFGAKLDARCNDDGDLPVDVALHAIRRRVWWTQKQSVCRLILMLSGDGMVEPIRTLMLLAGYRFGSGLIDLICRYAAKGKIIELAALYFIFVADATFWNAKIYMPSDFNLGKRMTLHQYVVNQIVLLYNEECKLTVIDSSQLVKCREKKQTMMSVLTLLEIFARGTIRMSSHIRAWEDKSVYFGVNDIIVGCLEVSEFELTDEDVDNVNLIGDLSDGCKEISERPNRNSSEDFWISCIEERQQWLSHHNAMADCGWNKDDPEHKKQHPLRVALESLCSKRIMCHWMPNESLFKLITLLCLPKMKEALDTCRILVDKMERVNEVACCYAKEGKVFALTILLLLARVKVIDPTISEVKDDVPFKRSMTFRQFINHELAKSVDFECRVKGRLSKEAKMLSELCEKRKSAMISSLMVLDIFEKAGVALEGYLESRPDVVQKDDVVRDVMMLLQESGFSVQYKDIEISNRHHSSMVKALDEWHHRMQKLQKDAGKTISNGSLDEAAVSSPYVQHGIYLNAYKSIRGMRYAVKNFLPVKYPPEASCLALPAEPCRAFLTSKANYSSGVPKVSGLGLGKSTGHTVLENKQLIRLCSIVKRGIKYI